MSFDEVMTLTARWGGTLKFFPGDPDARLGIAEQIADMARDADQVRWLVRRLPKLYPEWPSSLEVRAVFCSKFRPLDGIEAYSAVYLDGIPSEREELQISTGPVREIEAGEDVSGSTSISATVSDLVRAKDLNRKLRNIPPPSVREIPVVQITDENRITKEQLDAIAREIRERKAREEADIQAEKPNEVLP